jgi:hypothetical protein
LIIIVVIVFVINFIIPQIEELYSEVLYEILHIVGCDASAEEERTPLFCYLQEAFKLDYEKHNELLEMAQAKEVNVIHFSLFYCCHINERS